MGSLLPDEGPEPKFLKHKKKLAAHRRNLIAGRLQIKYASALMA